jgi:hypothetical protein
MQEVTPAIEFDATVWSVKTTVDGGLIVAFALPEQAIEAAAQLMAARQQKLYLHVVVTATEPVSSQKTARKSKIKDDD